MPVSFKSKSVDKRLVMSPRIRKKSPGAVDDAPRGEGLLDVCRLRAHLEVFATRKIHGDKQLPKLLEELETLLKQMRAIARKGNYEQFHVVDREFHGCIVEMAQIPLLGEAWNAAFKALENWSVETLRKFWPNVMVLYQEHVILFEALRGGNLSDGCGALIYHMEAVWDRIAYFSDDLCPRGLPEERAAAFMSTYFRSPISIEWIASNVSFVGAGQLTRRFSNRYGLTPLNWLKRVRVERAAEILRQDKSISVSEVARSVGYRDTSRFIECFREHFDQTPLKFRASLLA